MRLCFHGAIIIIFVGCSILASQSSTENAISGEIEDRTGFSGEENVTPNNSHSGQVQKRYGYGGVQLNILAEVARLKVEELKVLIPKLVNIQREMEELLSPNNTGSSVALYEERIDEAGNNLRDVTNELIGLQAVSRQLTSVYHTVVSQSNSTITKLEDIVDSGVGDKRTRLDLSLLLHGDGDRLSFGRTPIVPSFPAESNKFLVKISNNLPRIQLDNLQYGLNRMVWDGDSVAPGSISGYTTFSFRSYKQPAMAIFAYEMGRQYLLLAMKEQSLSSAAIYAGVLDSLNPFSDAQVLLLPESTDRLIFKNNNFKIRLNYKLDENEKTYKVTVSIDPISTWR